MKPKPSLPFWVRVPASTANLGPGFDTFGLALRLYNYIGLLPGHPETPHPFAEEIFRAYHQSRRLPPQPLQLVVRGSVPRSRGLGSSATIRLGLLAALDHHYRRPLDLPWCLRLATSLEGHPDNVTAAALGGFVVCGGAQPASAQVSSRLRFVAAIPSQECSTPTARALLPSHVTLEDAVANLRHASRLTAAFFSKKYEEAKGSFSDRLHQPYRASLVPGLEAAISQAEKAGAIGAFLSGAGPTILALTLKSEKAVGLALAQALGQAGHQSVQIKILSADNAGLRFLRTLPKSSPEMN